MDNERLWFGVEGARRRLWKKRATTNGGTCLTDCWSTERRSFDITTRFIERRPKRGSNRCCAGTLRASILADFAPLTRTVQERAPACSAFVHRSTGPAACGRLVVIELKVAEAREHVCKEWIIGSALKLTAVAATSPRRQTLRRAKITTNPAAGGYLVRADAASASFIHALARSSHPDIDIYRSISTKTGRGSVRVMRSNEPTKPCSVRDTLSFAGQTPADSRR